MIDSTAKLVAAKTAAAEVWLDGGTTLYLVVQNGRMDYGAFPKRGTPYTGGEYPYVPASALWFTIPVRAASDKILEARLDERDFARELRPSK